MTGDRVDTRPLRSAAQQQTGVVLAGTLGSGAGGSLGLVYLASLSTYDLPVSRIDLLIAVALSAIGAAAPTAVAQLVALARTVRLGEADTTPWRAPRNDRGEVLRPPDQDAYERAVTEVAELRAAAAVQARPPTSAFPAVGDARPMRADALAAADGPSSKQLHADYTGERVRAYDESRARERGRAAADRRDRLAAQTPRHYQTDDRR